MKEFRDRIAVVTGAASGIGRGMARAFAEEGMRLVLADIEEAALDRVARELTDAGAEVIGQSTDVSSHAQVEKLALRCYESFGAVHVLCNNAGVAENNAPVWEYAPNDWDWVLGVNLMGVVHGVRAFVPRMLESGEPGHVVNTASIGGLISGTAMPIYCVSKHAVVALSECLYNDLNRREAAVGVSVLCPGWVRSGIADSDRNREGAPEPSRDMQRSRERFRRSVDGGIEPDVVGRLVVDGIREGRFYLLTHPDWNYVIEERFEAIRDGRRPASTRLPRA